MQNWESLIAERKVLHKASKDCLIEDPVMRNKRNLERRYDASEKGKERHRKWSRTWAGRLSQKNRTARYNATEKGKANSRKKSNAFYARHKDDPEFKARRSEYDRIFRLRRKASKMSGIHTLFLIGGTVTTELAYC